MKTELPEGTHPFLDDRLDLSDMAMVEAPADLEALFKSQARSNGIELIRDAMVELTCAMPDDRELKFTIYWPSGQDRIHMLVPKEHAKNRA